MKCFYIPLRNYSIFSGCFVSKCSRKSQSRSPTISSWSPYTIRPGKLILSNLNRMYNPPTLLNSLSLQRMIRLMQNTKLINNKPLTNNSPRIPNINRIQCILIQQQRDKRTARKSNINSR